jgi:hypothetical protein
MAMKEKMNVGTEADIYSHSSHYLGYTNTIADTRDIEIRMNTVNRLLGSCAVSQKTVYCIVIAVKTSNLTRMNTLIKCAANKNIE